MTSQVPNWISLYKSGLKIPSVKKGKYFSNLFWDVIGNGILFLVWVIRIFDSNNILFNNIHIHVNKHLQNQWTRIRI